MTDATPAAAAPSTTWNWGDLAVNILTAVNKVTDVAATTLFNTYVPGVYRMFVSSSVITQAVDYAFGAVEGAVKGKELDLPIAAQVAQAATMFVKSIAPTLQSQLIGPAENLVIAELVKLGALPANATATSLGLQPSS